MPALAEGFFFSPACPHRLQDKTSRISDLYNQIEDLEKQVHICTGARQPTTYMRPVSWAAKWSACNCMLPGAYLHAAAAGSACGAAAGCCMAF